MVLASSLFTCFFSVAPSSPDTYYTSFERYFQGKHSAEEIVRIGLGEAEIFNVQVGSIELVEDFGGKYVCV